MSAAESDDASLQFLAAIDATFCTYKDLAERAVAQVPDAALHVALDANTNSIAVIMKHVSGNLRSRWTEFRTTDGEKPWRARDEEFVDDLASRAAILADWESGWQCVLGAIRSLKVEDLSLILAIRGEPHTVARALERSLAHTAYHVG
ncbi:MAG: DUF1572 family protein, partial [Phycisphaerae bacterium]|nr:DUF1572 family protein [Phycisphaerae bacterium]